MGGRKGILTGVLAAAALLLCAATAGAAWQPAVPISGAGSSPYEDFAIAANPRGDALVVWRNWVDPYNSTLEAVRRSAGGAWGRSAIVSDPPEFYPDPRPNARTAHPDDPSVAVAPSGEAIVAWAGAANSSSDYNGADYVRVMVLPAGQLSGPRLTLARATTTRVKTAVGYDSHGNATLFFWDGSGLWVSTRPAAGSFSTPTRVSRDGEMVSDARFAFAANGAVAGIFNGSDGIGYVVRDPGHALIRGTLVSPALPVQGLNVAINDTGTAVFAWSQCANPDVCDRGELKARHRPPGGALGAVEPIVSTWASPALAVSPGGEATAVFAGTSAEAPLLASTRAPGGRFGAPRTVSTVPPGGLITAAYDRGGNLHASWNSYYGADPQNARPWVALRPAGGSWQAALNPPGVPNLAAGLLVPGAGDRMLAAWTDENDVRASDFLQDTAAPAPPAPVPPADADGGEAASGDGAPAGGQGSGADDQATGPAPAPTSADDSGGTTTGTGSSTMHQPVASAVTGFTRRLSAVLARGAAVRLRRGRPISAWFVAPAEGRLRITLRLGRTVLAVAQGRAGARSLVTLRPRRAALKRAAGAFAGRRRPALKLRVVFRPDGGAPAASSRSFRPKR